LVQPLGQSGAVAVCVGAQAFYTPGRQLTEMLLVIVLRVGLAFPDVKAQGVTCIVQIAGADETIAAIVARPHQYQYGRLLGRGEMFLDHVGHCLPRPFHHLRIGVAALVGGALHRLHLGHRDNFEVVGDGAHGLSAFAFGAFHF